MVGWLPPGGGLRAQTRAPPVEDLASRGIPGRVEVR
jgi:hypothetical protein